MEGLKKWVMELRSRPRPADEQEIFNVAREYLQVLCLKKIAQSKFGGALSFMGGTCLRICYDLKRYSQDLYFAWDDRKVPYDFSLLIDRLQNEMTLSGFNVSTNVHAEKTVQKAFLRFADLPETLALQNLRREQKLHIKIEVDVRAVPLKKGDRESFFVHRFDEMFPILKHSLPTLFAGKILAIFFRPYPRGRDYYDLLWYLKRKIQLNLAYLNRGIRDIHFKNIEEVLKNLQDHIQRVRPETILKDIGRFLEDPSEAVWIARYREVFAQLLQGYRFGP